VVTGIIIAVVVVIAVVRYSRRSEALKLNRKVTGTETDSCPSQVETEIWESQAS
jgi:hypothetical protein